MPQTSDEANIFLYSLMFCIIVFASTLIGALYEIFIAGNIGFSLFTHIAIRNLFISVGLCIAFQIYLILFCFFRYIGWRSAFEKYSGRLDYLMNIANRHAPGIVSRSIGRMRILNTYEYKMKFVAVLWPPILSLGTSVYCFKLLALFSSSELIR